MKPEDLLKELAYPFTDLTVLLALVVFVVLTTLAQAAGLLGLWLGIILIPAFWRYMLQLLEARAIGRPAPVPGIELFNIADNFWTLTPLVLEAIAIWGIILLRDLSMPAASFLGLSIAIVFPASVAVLAITRSPFASLNPATMWRMIQACGWDYLLILLIIPLTALLAAFSELAGVPSILTLTAAFYSSFLLFTFTGAVLNANDVQFLAEIPQPLETSADATTRQQTRDRARVLTHAYGFVSRGNQAGGLAHVQSMIQEEADRDDAYRWYFDQMLTWEYRDAALAFAQLYLSWLLAGNRDVEALKLMTRCQLESPAFRPLQGDRPIALAVARRFKRDDLEKSLV